MHWDAINVWCFQISIVVINFLIYHKKVIFHYDRNVSNFSFIPILDFYREPNGIYGDNWNCRVTTTIEKIYVVEAQYTMKNTTNLYDNL